MAPAVRPRHKFSGNSLRKVAKKALLMPGETGEAHGAVTVIDECLSGTASEFTYVQAATMRKRRVDTNQNLCHISYSARSQCS